MVSFKILSTIFIIFKLRYFFFFLTNIHKIQKKMSQTQNLFIDTHSELHELNSALEQLQDEYKFDIDYDNKLIMLLLKIMKRAHSL